MSRVSDRPARPTIPFDSQKLARETEDDDDLEIVLADPPAPHPRVVPQAAPPAPAAPRRAAGTTPRDGIRARSVTVQDPCTTSLLAEVARRTQRIETAPLRPEDAVEPRDSEFDELTPTTSPGFNRR
jgi:hypothetical protein